MMIEFDFTVIKRTAKDQFCLNNKSNEESNSILASKCDFALDPLPTLKQTVAKQLELHKR
jgi:hypothetical protein